MRPIRTALLVLSLVLASGGVYAQSAGDPAAQAPAPDTGDAAEAAGDEALVAPEASDTRDGATAAETAAPVDSDSAATSAESDLAADSGAAATSDPAAPDAAASADALELSLADAIARGIERSLDVEIQRHTPLIAEEEHASSWGAYDPESFAEFGYSDTETPTANAISVGASLGSVTHETLDGEGGFRGLIPWWGASYEISLLGERTETDVFIQSLSPELNSEVAAHLRVPFLRGLIWNEPWTRVKVTAALSGATQAAFAADLMDAVQNIENSYWMLVAEEERLKVAEKSLETARALVDQTQTQYEVGVVSRVEVAQANAGAAARDYDLIVARNRYLSALDNLADLVLGTDLEAGSDVVILPTDRPDAVIADAIDPEEAARIAFESRPELEAARLEIQRREIETKFARNQRLPQLDGVVSYGFQGLGGTGGPLCGAFSNGGIPTCAGDDYGSYNDTFDDYLEPEGTDQFAARAFFSIPIPNTAARHQVRKADLELRRALTQQKRIEQGIVLEVRKAVRDLDSSREGIEAARRQQEAAAEQLRAERVKLEYGESTPFDVLQREEEFVEAEQGLINAYQVYLASRVGLDRAQGTILRNRNIQLEDAAQLR